MHEVALLYTGLVRTSAESTHYTGVASPVTVEPLPSSSFLLLFIPFNNLYKNIFGAWGRVVVKALRCKSEGPGIDSKRCRLESFCGR